MYRVVWRLLVLSDMKAAVWTGSCVVVQAGKVILAVDSNTELSKLSGGGPLLYVKFKAKRDEMLKRD